MDSHLVYAAKMDRGESITGLVPTLEIDIRKDGNGLVLIDITAKVTDELVQFVTSLGGVIVYRSNAFNSLTARVPMQSIETIATRQEVIFINRGLTAKHAGIHCQ